MYRKQSSVLSSSWTRAGQAGRSAGRMCICFSTCSVRRESASIPPQRLLCSRMTFRLPCHFYWFSCCVGERRGVGEVIRGEGERTLVPWHELKMELCVLCLVVFFKWPSNPAAVRLPFLAFLSVEVGLLWICLSLCWGLRRRWREEGKGRGS